jgi:hypothetical protein
LTNQVIVIEQKLDETTKQALRSVGTVPSGSYLEQPVINLNFTNSFNGNRSRFEFNYRSGNGNGSGNGSWNAIGNGDFSSRPSRSRYINVPAASPTQAPPAPMPAPQTSQWSPAPTQGWYVPPPQDQPMQSSVGQAAPTYSAPYAYNVSYSYVPPINFGFSWGGGHYGGRGH